MHLRLFCPVVVLLAAGCAAGRVPADLVLTGGTVYTVDPALPRAEALAVSGGRIAYVGSQQGVEAWIGPATQRIDLAGGMVLPGFHDAHVHPITSGLEMGECVLTEASTRQAVLDTIRRYAEAHPDRPWIRGAGWDLPLFPDGNPTAAMLDEVVGDRPAYMEAADGHSAWVSSAALHAAGLDADTPDPPRGRIERDPESGAPSGTLRESAMDLVHQLLPAYTPGDYLAGLRRGLAAAAEHGITSLYEARANAHLLEAYATLDRSGELSARVVASIQVEPARGVEQVPALVALGKRHRGPRLRADAAKIFLDGVIEAHTAALLEPYVDRPEERGTPNLEPAELEALVVALDRAGLQIHLHVIGDRAVRMGLDALEAARQANGPRDARHHLAHLQLIDPADVPRFAQLGVIANFQPLWSSADTYITDLTIPVLGPERSRWLYPLRSVRDAGAHLAFGSDWSVSSLDPLDAMQVAVTRRALDAGPGPAWLPEQTLTLADAIAGYTSGGAYLAFAEDERGTLAVGKLADLVVLDRDPFAVAPHRIHETAVRLTVLEGKVVYDGRAR